MVNILIVDDEPQIRRILSVLLVEKRFCVAEAETGEQAILKSNDFHPDLALLDVNLPGISGLDTLRALLERHKNLDCIMMTAYGTIRSAIDAIRMGAFDYLTKPFDNNELIMIVERALELRRLSREVEDL